MYRFLSSVAPAALKLPLIVVSGIVAVRAPGTCQAQPAASLPPGVRAVWDPSAARRETTPTRERISINGLWRWQPAATKAAEIPADRWGHFKVPGAWPGTVGEYMWRESQTLYPHPAWRNEEVSRVNAAWYQREITIPKHWAGRRIAVYAEYLNSYAAVYIDGKKLGEMRFPRGDVEITSACRPGEKHLLSMRVVAMPLEAVIASYGNTNEARPVEGRVARRGLCGDVFLVSTPAGPRIADVKVDTSVRKWQIALDAGLQDLRNDRTYALVAQVLDGGRAVTQFRSKPFRAENLQEGRFAFGGSWKPERLWDTHTPENTYELRLSLIASSDSVLDTHHDVRFGFREFWIDGRDFRLNGTRFFAFAVPLDNAQISAAAASYDAARETMLRLKSFGVNMVYTHNYGCQPGSHLGFAEILRAADDAGMLVSLSQPHFAHYDWKSPDADRANGYALHAEFYVRQAQNHPAVVMYSTSHNAAGYSEDMNPDRMDGVRAGTDRRLVGDTWASNNVKLALRAEAVLKRFDRTRIVCHHAGGSLGPVYTSNFYLNFVPIQERSDWFEHWSTRGVKPLLLFEYGVPWGMNWTMYRGWYEGKRDFGGAAVPWQFCTAEWNAQFLGDRAFRLDEMEKENLRFEARQARAGRRWHRWDYPFPVIGLHAPGHTNKDAVWSMYMTDNWRAFRTWGLSGFNAWSYGNFWALRRGVDKSRKTFEVDWENLQRPGFSPDYLDGRYERVDTAYERSDWQPTAAADALIRNNQPLLAYIGGKSPRFTSRDHNFHPGQAVEKQIIVINNSRQTVTCDCAWSLGLPQPVTGRKRVRVETGEQARVVLRPALPATLAPGEYRLTMAARFSSGETQEDSFPIHVLPPANTPRVASKIALFDPKGETAGLLRAMGVACAAVGADADLSAYDVLIVGKAALSVEGPAPDISRVRDGLRVLVFEQGSEVLEKRLGFRVQEYGLRRVFKRVLDHPTLDALDTEHLSDWRGAATIVPPRLRYQQWPQHGPAVRWCGIKVTRPWRCGCYGNVASVLIEKPAVGDFLPIVDGGFGLQYSPLLQYREGKGMILFCQIDVTGRTQEDPAARRLVANMLEYASAYSPPPRRTAGYVGDPAGRDHFRQAGLSLAEYRGGALSPDQVLVVGPGGAAKLAPHKEAVAAWLKAGGRLLAIGLDEPEAAACLPLRVSMKEAEHICACFGPEGRDSPLAGIGAADVLLRDPRPLPLVDGGARGVGNGVLAVSEDANVVFCQLVPWQFDYEKLYHLKMTYRRTSFLVTRLLANMGASGTTPILARFSSPPGAEDVSRSVVRNGNFGVDADRDGLADHWSFHSSPNQATFARERVAPRTDRWSQRLVLRGSGEKQGASAMLAQYDVPVKKGQWYRVSLRAKSGGLEGARVNMTIMDTETWRPLFEYERFAPDGQWRQFAFYVQSKHTADSAARFQLWYEKPGTVWFSDVRMEPCDPPWQGRWLSGLYLDTPVEMDDPYRFFRW